MDMGDPGLLATGRYLGVHSRLWPSRYFHPKISNGKTKADAVNNAQRLVDQPEDLTGQIPHVLDCGHLFFYFYSSIWGALF